MLKKKNVSFWYRKTKRLVVHITKKKNTTPLQVEYCCSNNRTHELTESSKNFKRPLDKAPAYWKEKIQILGSGNGLLCKTATNHFL